MNERDSEIMASLLKEGGWTLTDEPESADAVLINTCAVREHAVVRAFGRANNLKRLKYNNPDTIIGMVGCIPQTETGRVKSEIPHLDLILGTGELLDISTHLKKAFESKETVISCNSRRVSGIPPIAGLRGDEVTAFISIMRGCDNRCSYCIVPEARGSEVYRNVEDILKEVELLEAGGYKEITLIGQNVNSWRDNKYLFSDLLREIEDKSGIPNIRFVTSHPASFTGDIISVMAECPSICEALHLPLQSGSNRILKLMNRGYSIEEYSDIIFRLREEIPDIAITTDLIAGFPGETERDFDDTLKTLEEVEFDGAFTFKYSPRVKTPAIDFPGKVPEDVKTERLKRLIKTTHKVGKERNTKRLGKKYMVLVERKAKKGGMMGRARTNHPVIIDADVEIGELVEVEITEVSQWTLKGKLLSK
jgi:tRNA-2-methylthio-N6-dimethylallyladenosine synthase